MRVGRDEAAVRGWRGCTWGGGWRSEGGGIGFELVMVRGWLVVRWRTRGVVG